MVTFIVALFIVGYLCIALESILKINKAAPALLMCVGCWVLYMMDAGTFIPRRHLRNSLLPHGRNDHRGNR